MRASKVIANLVIAAAGLILPRLSYAIDLPVSYLVDAKTFKSVLAGENLTFTLFTDSACTMQFDQEIIVAGSGALQTEAVKPVKVKAQLTKPAKAVRLLSTLTPPGLDDTLYLTVTGTGILAIGNTCQPLSPSDVGIVDNTVNVTGSGGINVSGSGGVNVTGGPVGVANNNVNVTGTGGIAVTGAGGVNVAGGYLQFQKSGAGDPPASDCNSMANLGRLYFDTQFHRVFVCAGLAWGSTTLDMPTKQVFVTSSTFTGSLGGLTGADAQCQLAANNAALTGTFKAWLSDSTQSPSMRFTQWPGPYQLVDGTTVAESWLDLISGGLENQIFLDENGNFNSVSVWTNTKTDGTGKSAVSSCTNWMSGSSGVQSSDGRSDRSDQRWTDNNTANCNSTFSLYCFEQ